MRGFGLFATGFQRGRTSDAPCPHCKTTAAEVRRTGLAGCPLCYDAFPEKLWNEFGVTPGSWSPAQMV